MAPSGTAPPMAPSADHLGAPACTATQLEEAGELLAATCTVLQAEISGSGQHPPGFSEDDTARLKLAGTASVFSNFFGQLATAIQGPTPVSVAPALPVLPVSAAQLAEALCKAQARREAARRRWQ